VKHLKTQSPLERSESYGINEFLGRRMREPLAARGIDVERLRVE
jgi:hypothetical protein